MYTFATNWIGMTFFPTASSLATMKHWKKAVIRPSFTKYKRWESGTFTGAQAHKWNSEELSHATEMESQS